MPVELREITIHATRPHDQVGYAQFFAVTVLTLNDQSNG
jgi:hypothetical protein